MPKTLTDAQQKKIKKAIYKKADEFGYMTSGRIESGRFMDELVDDPDIGGVLKEYMTKERIRTYIKDGVLNAYTKAKNRSALSTTTPEATVENLFSLSASIIQRCNGKNSGVFVLRAENGSIFVVSSGTTLKWETALRKALELIAREPRLSVEGKTPFICLQLSEASQELTEADRNHIRTALNAIGVKAVFCGNN
jgi:hypothetical protein